MKNLEVKAIISNKNSKDETFTLYLLDKESSILLPLEIDSVSAQIITISQQGFPAKRPQIHDALSKILELFHAEILSTVITGFTDGIFHSSIKIQHCTDIRSVDVRLSDAVALAVRLNKPIMVDEGLLELFGIKLSEELVNSNNLLSEDM